MGPLSHVQKLKDRSLDEIRVRGVQAVRAQFDRLAFARRVPDAPLHRLIDRDALAGRRLTESALLAHFRQRAPTRFFLGLADRDASTAAFRRRWPGLARSIAHAADRVLGGALNVFGHEIAIGTCPDWTLEPRSGLRTPPLHFSRVPYLDPQVCGDSKLTWEINRHQYFLILGRAYWLTGDERYARTWTRQISAWLDANPPGCGINWTSSLEVALRSIAWIWSLHLFRHSAHLDERLFSRIVASLHAHGRHVERYLSTYFSPNTHLTGEALGLLYLGMTLPELQRARTWRATGSRILQEELCRQLFPDGVHFEQSTYYHRYTADFYIHALLLAEAGGLSLGAPIRQALPAMLEFLLAITRPDGSSPLIGDDDGGRLLPLGSLLTNDFRDTLGVGAVVLGRTDLASVAGPLPEDVLWLLGPDSLPAFDELPPREPTHTSRAFAASGYYVMRDGWRSTSSYLIVRCGPHGALTGAHAHADALSIELAVGGRPLLIDSGTYTYAPAQDRDVFRATAAHNTVSIGGESSSMPGSTAFSWRSVARSRALAWVTHPSFDFFEGEHDGYVRLDPPAIHSRAVFFVKEEYCVVDDRVECDGTPHWMVHLHFAPGLDVRPEGPAALCITQPGGEEQRLHFFTQGNAVLSCEPEWISPGYGRRTIATACVLRGDERARRSVMVVAAADAVCWERCAWRESSRDGGSMLTVALPEWSDTILTGSSKQESSASRDGVSADARWTWVRRTPAGSASRFAAVDARYVAIDGQTLLSCDEAVELAFGTRSDGGWTIETRRGDVVRAWSMTGGGAETLCVGSAG